MALPQNLKVISALPEKKPQLSISKEGMALGCMLVAITLAGVGAGMLWGGGGALLAVGILLFVFSILLSVG